MVVVAGGAGTFTTQGVAVGRWAAHLQHSRPPRLPQLQQTRVCLRHLCPSPLELAVAAVAAVAELLSLL